jgi:hypothetical protein
MIFQGFAITFELAYRERPREGPCDVLATCSQGANSHSGKDRKQMSGQVLVLFSVFCSIGFLN